MGGYTKNIAVIRGLKEGFSSNGGELSGLVKVEKYGLSLRAETVKINFAPLSEGKYVTALSDGETTVVFEGDIYDGESRMQTGEGFAALICFVNTAVQPVAWAVCGNFQDAAAGLKAEVERAFAPPERPKDRTAAKKKEEKPYEDEAIAEDNYYEYESRKNDEDGGAVRKAETQKKDGRESEEDEIAAGSGEKARRLKLAGGGFYKKMKNEIEGLLRTYPPEEELCSVVENSRWVKISYDGGKYYVFGVIYEGETPRYLCYGVPAETPLKPPESMKPLASYIPSLSGGWWMTYQDAETGAAIKLEAE